MWDVCARTPNAATEGTAGPAILVASTTALSHDAREATSAAYALLDAEERARAERFRLDADRRRFVAGRALVRRTLSRMMDVDPSAWRFDANCHGRPQVAGPTEGQHLRFSASRSGARVLCAVTIGREIGADIERLRPFPETIARQFFSQAERRALEDVEEPRRADLFFSLWTLKEAYAKARGEGMAVPFDKACFKVDYDAPTFMPAAPLENDAARWRFALFDPEPSYRAALCIEAAHESEPLIEHWEYVNGCCQTNQA